MVCWVACWVAAERKDMAYFSNGSEGLDWQEENCTGCVHEDDCAIIHAHCIHNYSECNDSASILHVFIPYDDCVNGECRMRIEK